ncbi:hypothetical protein BGZ74_002052, partial [Mortierella antarctica]
LPALSEAWHYQSPSSLKHLVIDCSMGDWAISELLMNPGLYLDTMIIETQFYYLLLQTLYLASDVMKKYSMLEFILNANDVLGEMLEDLVVADRGDGMPDMYSSSRITRILQTFKNLQLLRVDLELADVSDLFT